MCEASLKLAITALEKCMRFNQGHKYSHNKVKGLSVSPKLIILNCSVDTMKSNGTNYKITKVDNSCISKLTKIVV